MSQIYVAEYPGLAQAEQGDSVSLLPSPPTVEYNVIVSAASSGAAAPFQPSTRWIEVSCDTTCSIVIGPFPGVIGTGSANVTNKRLQANERVVLGVPRFPTQTAPPGGGNPVPSRFAIFTTANV
jgi:hypothetical protein